MYTLQMAQFVVEYSAVVVTTMPSHNNPGQPHTYRGNFTQNILCDNLYKALEIFRERHPEADVHVVRKVGTKHQPILIDSAPIIQKALEEGDV